MLSAEGTSRLMAFADAVVAIAITLLVLPLVDIPSEATTTSMAEIMESHGAQYWWSNPALAALALLICLVVPGVGIWAMLVLFLDPVVTRMDPRWAGVAAPSRARPSGGTGPGRRPR